MTTTDEMRLDRWHGDQVELLTRRGMWVLGFGILPVVAWLIWAPLTSAVIAQGVVKIDTNRVPIQHIEGGLVSRVLVRDGQSVQQGETLIELGDVSVVADAQRLLLAVLGQEATIERLKAEEQHLSELRFGQALQARARSVDGAEKLLERERLLLLTHHQALENQLAALEAQRERLRRERDALQSQIENGVKSLGYQRQELEMSRGLARDQFISATRMNQLEAGVADYSAKLDERRAELARAEQRDAELELRMASLRAEYRQQAGEQLRHATTRLSELEQELRKSNDALTRQRIVAPTTGRLMNLRFNAPGVVIAPREVVADLVPDEQRLVIEVAVRPNDVAHVHQGQRASIRLAAYSQASLAPFSGRVVYLSPDRLVDGAGRSAWFSVHVDIDEAERPRLRDLGLHAGMPAEVALAGETRSVLAFLMEPITDLGWRGARER